MKQTSFILKSFAVIAMAGWSLTGNAQRYEIDRGRVFFGEDLVLQADVRSFEDLGCGYAKDRHNVYMYGRVLENVDPLSFRLKPRGTWRQTRHDEANESGPHKGYFKTKWNVYFGDKKIDALASSFEELGGGYAKDAFNVYYYGEKVEGAWAKSFKYMGDGYGEDNFNAFYRGRKLE